MERLLRRKQNSDVLRISAKGCNVVILMLSGGGNVNPSIGGCFHVILNAVKNPEKHIETGYFGISYLSMTKTKGGLYD